MSWRAHSALWVAGIACALIVAPGDPLVADEPSAIAARTEATLAAGGAVLAEAVRAQAGRLEPAWLARMPTGVDGQPTSHGRAAGASGPPHWPAYWRVVVLRIALLAHAALACWVVVLAGVVDGLAMRRARQAGLAPGSPAAFSLGGHALVALGFAPFAWAALPLDGAILAAPIWALCVAAALSFTLSRAAGSGAR